MIVQMKKGFGLTWLVLLAMAALWLVSCGGESSSGSGNTGDDEGPYEYSDGDSDTDGDADSDADSDGDADTDSDTDADTDSDTDGDTDGDGDSDGDADGDTDGDADGDADGDTDTSGDNAACVALAGTCRAVAADANLGCETNEVPALDLNACPMLQTCCLPVTGDCNGTCRAGQQITFDFINLTFPFCEGGESWDQAQTCPDSQGCCVTTPGCDTVGGTCRVVALTPTLGCESNEGVDQQHSCPTQGEVCCVAGSGSGGSDCTGTCREGTACESGETLDVEGSVGCSLNAGGLSVCCMPV